MPGFSILKKIAAEDKKGQKGQANADWILGQTSSFKKIKKNSAKRLAGALMRALMCTGFARCYSTGNYFLEFKII